MFKQLFKSHGELKHRLGLKPAARTAHSAHSVLGAGSGSGAGARGSPAESQQGFSWEEGLPAAQSGDFSSIHAAAGNSRADGWTSVLNKNGALG